MFPDSIKKEFESDAVAQALEGKAPKTDGILNVFLSPRQLANDFSSIMKGYADAGYKIVTFSVGWEEYQSFSHAGALGYVVFGWSSHRGLAQLADYGARKPNYGACWTDSFNNFSGWSSI